MTQYVHPEVSTREYDDSASVGLVIVPIEGERATVENAIEACGGTIENSVLDMLKVQVPADAIDEFVESDSIRSITPDDVEMENLDQGNLSIPRM